MRHPDLDAWENSSDLVVKLVDGAFGFVQLAMVPELTAAVQQLTGGVELHEVVVVQISAHDELCQLVAGENTDLKELVVVQAGIGLEVERTVDMDTACIVQIAMLCNGERGGVLFLYPFSQSLSFGWGIQPIYV